MSTTLELHSTNSYSLDTQFGIIQLKAVNYFRRRPKYASGFLEQYFAQNHYLQHTDFIVQKVSKNGSVSVVYFFTFDGIQKTTGNYMQRRIQKLVKHLRWKFYENSDFRKKFHLRCLKGLWIRLWLQFFIFISISAEWETKITPYSISFYKDFFSLKWNSLFVLGIRKGKAWDNPSMQHDVND